MSSVPPLVVSPVSCYVKTVPIRGWDRERDTELLIETLLAGLDSPNILFMK